MSRKFNLNDFTNEELEKMSYDLILTLEEKKEQVYLYDSEKDFAYVPFAYNTKFCRPKRQDLPQEKIVFVGEMRDEQKPVRQEAIKVLNDQGSVIVAACTGFGKTSIAINIASKIGLRVLVIVHRVLLAKQWKNRIEKFCPHNSAKIINPKDDMNKFDSTFGIINAINIPKFTRKNWSQFGLVIVDECHLILAQKISSALNYLTPRYLIGLSATPYRYDGLDSLFDLYFGTHKIVRELNREHDVYRIDTHLTYEYKIKAGRLDWAYVLDRQATNVNRNEKIIDLIREFPDRVFLVLCKRISQADYLYDRLKGLNENVDRLTGKKQDYYTECRVLITIVSKAGVGFDNPRLNSLIIAADVENYFIQYLGRVFRTQEVRPIIFDLVDDFRPLQKHYATREEVYEKAGGKTRIFSIAFPNFSWSNK